VFSHSPSVAVGWCWLLALHSSLEAHGLLLRRHGREQAILARSARNVRIEFDEIRFLFMSECPIILLWWNECLQQGTRARNCISKVQKIKQTVRQQYKALSTEVINKKPSA
jgi:hypothetical protein